MSVQTTVKDMSGRELGKGDTVSTLTGQMTGKIASVADEDGTGFICIRPPHQPYGHGVWHAADRCVLVAPNRPKDSESSGKSGSSAKSGKSAEASKLARGRKAGPSNAQAANGSSARSSTTRRSRKTPAKKK